MTQPTSIRLEPAELERIRHLATSTRRKQSDLIRYALELGLDQLERQQPPTCDEGKTSNDRPGL